MHFISWLEQQTDLEVTRIIIRDYNNGCLPPVRNYDQLRQHYLNKHPYTCEGVIAQLDAARKAYKDSLYD